MILRYNLHQAAILLVATQIPTIVSIDPALRYCQKSGCRTSPSGDVQNAINNIIDKKQSDSSSSQYQNKVEVSASDIALIEEAGWGVASSEGGNPSSSSRQTLYTGATDSTPQDSARAETKVHVFTLFIEWISVVFILRLLMHIKQHGTRPIQKKFHAIKSKAFNIAKEAYRSIRSKEGIKFSKIFSRVRRSFTLQSSDASLGSLADLIGYDDETTVTSYHTKDIERAMGDASYTTGASESITYLDESSKEIPLGYPMRNDNDDETGASVISGLTGVTGFTSLMSTAALADSGTTKQRKNTWKPKKSSRQYESEVNSEVDSTSGSIFSKVIDYISTKKVKNDDASHHDASQSTRGTTNRSTKIRPGANHRGEAKAGNKSYKKKSSLERPLQYRGNGQDRRNVDTGNRSGRRSDNANAQKGGSLKQRSEDHSIESNWISNARTSHDPNNKTRADNGESSNKSHRQRSTVNDKKDKPTPGSLLSSKLLQDTGVQNSNSNNKSISTTERAKRPGKAGNGMATSDGLSFSGRSGLTEINFQV